MCAICGRDTYTEICDNCELKIRYYDIIISQLQNIQDDASLSEKDIRERIKFIIIDYGSRK